MNVTRLGYEQVFMNIAGLVVAFVVLMLILLAITRLFTMIALNDRSPDGAQRN